MENKENNIEEIKEISSTNPFKQQDEEDVVNIDESENDNNIVEQEQGQEQNIVDDFRQKYEVLNNQYIRLAADFDNFRKRQAQEREQLLKYGAEETMKKLLEVLDNFDRGLKAVENIEDVEKVKESFNLVCNQMQEVLAKIGLEVIEAEGKEFNPNFHEAVMQTPTSEYPENTVITQLQKGYKMGDKVLRASLVNVATAE